MNIFDKIPKKVAMAILLLKHLDIRETLKLTQELLYLWREFCIKTEIKPKIVEYKVNFYYKDYLINKIEIKDIRDLLKIIPEIKKSQID